MTAGAPARSWAGRRLVVALTLAVALATLLAPPGGHAAVTEASPPPSPPSSSPPSSSPSSSPPPSPPSSPPSGRDRAAEALPGHLDAVVARMDDLVGSATVSIVVTDATGDLLWSAGPDRGLLPASTMKVLTAASVLDELGLRGVVPTGVAATAPVSRRGVVDGDVVVVGSGDPTLTTEDYRRWIHPARPSTPIEDLADVIVASGVRRITGDLVGDGTRFGPATTASGWPSRYFADLDAHHVAALTVDESWELVGPDAGPFRIDQEEDPARSATLALAQALADRGVVIEGRARRSTAPRAGFHPLGRVVSPPMAELLTFMLRESDNHLADTLVRTAALRDTGNGSWAAADRRLEVALAELGVDTSGLVIADGSGLSRNNRVSARQLVAVDVGLADTWGPAWSAMLAVVGESGTLEGRLVGTAAQGRLYAKTGTLSDVRALVGHVVGEGARYHFAMMVNDVAEDRRYLASVLGDDLTLALVDALDGCHRVREVETASGSRTRLVSPSVQDPGPNLADSAWRRRCPPR